MLHARPTDAPYEAYISQTHLSPSKKGTTCVTSHDQTFFDTNYYETPVNNATNKLRQCKQMTTLPLTKWQAVAELVEALRYKTEGRVFDSRWCHWNFSLT